MKQMSWLQTIVPATLVLLALIVTQTAQASQGCPFNDASCEDYCKQQGCNLGYCGHFAWIQCICRKCGQEWEWYDKVRLNEGKAVNQTELDSLKLNATVASSATSGTQTLVGEQKQLQEERLQEESRQQQIKQHEANSLKAVQQHASLASMLIPDLSDNSKLSSEFEGDEIPDESSERFLDFLARNHEKLAKVTSGKSTSTTTSTTTTPSPAQISSGGGGGTGGGGGGGADDDDDDDDDAIEIQIKTIASDAQQIEDPPISQTITKQTTAPTTSTTTISTTATTASITPGTPQASASSFQTRAAQEEENESTILDKLIRSAALID